MRYQWLDGFRGAAAIAVVLWHFRAQLGIPGFHFGFLAVDLFFVLSGIVLTIRFAREIEGSRTFASFAWARLRRLYPMALMAGLVVLALNALRVPAAFGENLGALSTLLVIPYAPDKHLDNAFPADPPEWSLYAELLCNVVWFAALKAGRRSTAALFVCAFAMFLYLAHAHGGVDMGWRPEYIEQAKAVVRALAGFGIGYFIARRQFNSRIHPGIAFALLVAACTLFEHSRHTAGGLAVIATGAFLLTSLMQREPALPWLRTLCTWLGMLSFPLYMTHAPAQRLAQLWVDRGGNVYLAYSVVLIGAGLSATMANEYVVRRLPSHLRSRKIPARTAAAENDRS